MPGRPGYPEKLPGADSARGQDTSRSGGRPPARGTNRGTNAFIERWLQLHLRQLYQEVCNEPLPSELNEMVDRFRRRRKEKEDEPGREAVVPLPPTARQGS